MGRGEVTSARPSEAAPAAPEWTPQSATSADSGDQGPSADSGAVLGETVRRVTRLSVAALILVRWGTVGQLGVAVIGGAIARAAVPAVSAAGMVVYVVGAAVVTAVLLRARRPDLLYLARCDLALMCLLMASERIYASPHAWVSSWDAWGYGASIPTAVLWGIAARSYVSTAVGMAVFSGAYVFGVAANIDELDGWGTVVANLGGVLVGAFAARGVWRGTRTIAERADEADRQGAINLALRAKLVEQATRFAEARVEWERRVRAQIHDYSNELASLARSPQDIDGRLDLRTRLAAMAGRLESELGPRGARDTLGRAIQNGASGTTVDVQMHIPKNVADLVLEHVVLERLETAVRSFVRNTERHSGVLAATVLGEIEGDHWVISLMDTGVGFDMGRTDMNVGLREDLGTALRSVGVNVSITSEPRAGVEVTLSGVVTAAT